MEDIIHSSKTFDVSYLINNDLQMKKLEFEIDNNLDSLSYEQITIKFFKSLEKIEASENYDKYYITELIYENIIFDFIRYLIDDDWIFLGENECIILKDIINSKIKLMIKITILSEDKIRVKKIYDKKVMEISEINGKIYDLSKKSSNINYTDISSNTNLDLVVLTANPLIHTIFDNNEIKEIKEFRTMNDFNKITNSIQRAINESLDSISAEFWPLTLSRFIEIISDEEYKPTILHLICKSTYIVPDNIPEGDKSNNYINIIFEKEDYNAQFINEKELKDIINSKKEIKKNIKDITLIISTQLAEDAKEMFKDLGFKNIIIQPTTLTDIDYISEFNYTFYRDIIFSEYTNIKDIYEDALYSYIDPQYDNIFCCCFHSHEKIQSKFCLIMTNLINELYYKENEESKNMVEIIPHFCHLKMTEKSNYYDYKSNFCLMRKQIFKKFKEEIKENTYKNKRNKKKNNIDVCCCHKDDHNIESIFFKVFSEYGKNNILKFGGKVKLGRNKYIPDFSKMELLVGRNKLVYDVITYIKNHKEFSINICCENKEREEQQQSQKKEPKEYDCCTISDLRELANIIIEYMKERETEDEQENNELTKKLSFEKNNIINQDDISIKNIKSCPILYRKKERYKIIDLTIQESNELNELDISNIYFIILDNNSSKKIIEHFNKNARKKIFFSIQKLEKIDFCKELKNLSLFNKYIKGQLKEVDKALLDEDN